MSVYLAPKTTQGAVVKQVEAGTWRMSLPAGSAGQYRLAQLDDYAQIPRRAFPWQPPLTLNLRARASSWNIPGTWGFGLWNDPFSFSLGFGGGTRRFPALPNAAWFFFAAPPNYLSLRDDQPAQGPLAATFQSPAWPTAGLSLALPLTPLLAFRVTARPLRRLARRWILQDASTLKLDHETSPAAAWHTYSLHWHADQAAFLVDEDLALKTAIAPMGPLGLVIWVDNQFAALPPNAGLSFGSLPNPEPVWIEIADLEIQPERVSE